jgi:hypothetical protein
MQFRRFVVWMRTAWYVHGLWWPLFPYCGCWRMSSLSSHSSAFTAPLHRSRRGGLKGSLATEMMLPALEIHHCRDGKNRWAFDSLPRNPAAWRSRRVPGSARAGGPGREADCSACWSPHSLRVASSSMPGVGCASVTKQAIAGLELLERRCEPAPGSTLSVRHARGGKTLLSSER